MEEETAESKLHADLQERVNQHHHNVIQITLEAMLASALSSRTSIDKFSTWLLAGTGGAVVLLINNVSDIVTIISKESFQISISALSVSMLFGIIAKYLEVDIQYLVSYRNSRKTENASLTKDWSEFQDEIKKIKDEHHFTPKIGDTKQMIENEIQASTPWWNKKKSMKMMKKCEKDPLYPLKNGKRTYERQKIYVSLQVAFVFVFIIVATSGIS